MASAMTVKVHPVVYFTIVDAFERRSNKEGANDKALGTLLGFYEKNGVQVTNCFAIPFSEQNEEAPELDDSYNQQMLQSMKKASPNEGPVGWFYTNADLSIHTLSYHDYYNRVIAEHAGAKKETQPVVLLTVDTTFGGPDHRMDIKAYLRTKAGIPGNREPHCAIFNPIKEGKSQMNVSMGRKIMDSVQNAASQLQPEKLENLLKNSMRDYLMVSYLAQLAKTQLALHERMIAN